MRALHGGTRRDPPARDTRCESGVPLSFSHPPHRAAQAIARAKKAREDRKNAAPTQIDGMQLDPQAAELNAAGGLKSKVLSEDEIELRWETSDETGNAGFIVQRRAGGAADFENLESFESFAPLKTKGQQVPSTRIE